MEKKQRHERKYTKKARKEITQNNWKYSDNISCSVSAYDFDIKKI